MTNIHLVQFVGVILTIVGIIALMASAQIFGTRLSLAEKRRAGDEWNRRGDVYRLPINLETIVSVLFFLGGIGILSWSKFDLCGFLGYWLPSLPEVVRLFLSCR